MSKLFLLRVLGMMVSEFVAGVTAGVKPVIIAERYVTSIVLLGLQRLCSMGSNTLSPEKTEVIKSLLVGHGLKRVDDSPVFFKQSSLGQYFERHADQPFFRLITRVDKNGEISFQIAPEQLGSADVLEFKVKGDVVIPLTTGANHGL